MDVERSRFSPSILETVLTVSPITAYFFLRGEPTFPAKASPVCTATPMASGGGPEASHCRLSCWRAACIRWAGGTRSPPGGKGPGALDVGNHPHTRGHIAKPVAALRVRLETHGREAGDQPQARERD